MVPKVCIGMKLWRALIRKSMCSTTEVWYLPHVEVLFGRVGETASKDTRNDDGRTIDPASFAVSQCHRGCWRVLVERSTAHANTADNGKQRNASRYCTERPFVQNWAAVTLRNRLPVSLLAAVAAWAINTLGLCLKRYGFQKSWFLQVKDCDTHHECHRMPRVAC